MARWNRLNFIFMCIMSCKSAFKHCTWLSIVCDCEDNIWIFLIFTYFVQSMHSQWINISTREQPRPHSSPIQFYTLTSLSKSVVLSVRWSKSNKNIFCLMSRKEFYLNILTFLLLMYLLSQCSNQSSVSAEDHLMASIHFCYFAFILLWRKTLYLIWTIINSLCLRMLCK